MPQKKHKPEEIVAKLRQVDVLVSQGQSVAEAVRSIGVTQFTYYRWRKEFGGLKSDQVKRLKDAHLAFQSLIETNQIVLATARAVSESIVRDLAADANKPMRANGYGPAATVGAGVFARPNSGPLVVSRRL